MGNEIPQPPSGASGASKEAMEAAQTTCHYHRDPCGWCVPIAILLDNFAASRVAELRKECVNTHASADRLIAWIKSNPRKPANLAFTEGPDRQVAYAIEMELDYLKSRVEAAERVIVVVEKFHEAPYGLQSASAWNDVVASLAAYDAQYPRGK